MMRAWAVGVMLVASVALAKPADKGLIDKYQQVAEELAERDKKRGAAVLELGTLREWLGEARAYLRQEAEEPLKITMERVRVQARLIDAIIGRAISEGAAREAHAAADATENEAGRLNNEAAELENTLRELEKTAATPAGGAP